MARFRCFPVAALVILLMVGCGGSSRIKAKGRILLDGAAFHTNEGEGFRIFFSPSEPVARTFDSYAAIYDNKAGQFQVMGKDGQGLPPGKYRVNLQLMKNREDLFRNKLMGVDSPLTCEVTSGGADVVIDLDPVKDKLPAR
jgi:hypothetical protein